MRRCESGTDNKLLLCRKRMAKLSSEVRVRFLSEGLPRQVVGFVQCEAMLSCKRGDTLVVRMVCDGRAGSIACVIVANQLTTKE